MRDDPRALTFDAQELTDLHEIFMDLEQSRRYLTLGQVILLRKIMDQLKRNEVLDFYEAAISTTPPAADEAQPLG